MITTSDLLDLFNDRGPVAIDMDGTQLVINARTYADGIIIQTTGDTYDLLWDDVDTPMWNAV